ncbi:MAG: recombinase family protein [Patescibacteria group bacterium]|nr:recombinase family protein [Patescibacteria group bacterium]
MLLGYARVSTVEQAADDRSSLENQEKIIRGYAMAKGFNQFDTAIYTDPGVSASIPLSKRPAGAQLLADAKADDVIIAAKLDRMFRSASNALNMIESFQEKKIKLVLFDFGSEPISDSALGQFFFTTMAAVAQLERTLIRERLMSGKRAKKEKNGHIGGKAPYGYQIKGHGREAMLVANEQEQEIIATVKRWMGEQPGVSIAELTRQLGYQELVSRNGKEFIPRQVGRIVKQLQHGSQ